MQNIVYFCLNCVIFTILALSSYIRPLDTSTQKNRFFISYTPFSAPGLHQHSQWLILCDFLRCLVVFHNSLFPNYLMGAVLLSKVLLLLSYHKCFYNVSASNVSEFQLQISSGSHLIPLLMFYVWTQTPWD